MIGRRASKSFAGEGGGGDGAVLSGPVHVGASTERGGYSVWVWLNLVCLDAPIVAVSWQWFFARTFGVPLATPNRWALFLTAWLIYLVDRWGDSLSLKQRAPISLRQRFCLRHRGAWLAGAVAIALADLVVILTCLESRTFLPGAEVGALALAYLISNRFMPSLWRTLPLKEICIGFLFATGTMVALGPGLTSAMLPAGLLFSCLCWLNCISIAVWERELDFAQNRISIATTFPQIGRCLFPAGAIIALSSSALALFEGSTRAIYVCIAASALLLGSVHFLREKIVPDTRTALADLVLLMPLLVFLFTAG